MVTQLWCNRRHSEQIIINRNMNINQSTSDMMFRQENVKVNRQYQKFTPFPQQAKTSSIDSVKHTRSATNLNIPCKLSKKSVPNHQSTKGDVIRMMVLEKQSIQQNYKLLDIQYKRKVRYLEQLREKYNKLKSQYSKLENRLGKIPPFKISQTQQDSIPLSQDFLPAQPPSPLSPMFNIDMLHFNVKDHFKTTDTTDHDSSDFAALLEKERLSRYELQNQNQYLLKNLEELKARKEQKKNANYGQNVMRLQAENRSLTIIARTMKTILNSDHRNSIKLLTPQ